MSRCSGDSSSQVCRQVGWGGGYLKENLNYTGIGMACRF